MGECDKRDGVRQGKLCLGIELHLAIIGETAAHTTEPLYNGTNSRCLVDTTEDSILACVSGAGKARQRRMKARLFHAMQQTKPVFPIPVRGTRDADRKNTGFVRTQIVSTFLCLGRTQSESVKCEIQTWQGLALAWQANYHLQRCARRRTSTCSESVGAAQP